MKKHSITLKGTFMSNEDAIQQWMRGNLIDNIDGYSIENEIEFIDDMLDDDTAINFNIDSIGGDYKHGWLVRYAIQNLAKRREVFMTATGDVGSTASMVFMSVKKENRIVKKGSTGFIHNPSMVVVGEAKDHEKVAKVLRDTEKEMIKVYAEDMEISEEEAKKYMDESTLFSSDMMVESGFAGKSYTEEEEEKTDHLISAIWQKSCIDGACKVHAEHKSNDDLKNFINQL